jgi:oligopeptide/dipeptide ABC transporter ATP-binding protein
MTVLIEARHASKRYGNGPEALSDFSMAIDADRPAITAVVGESGSGKTTLARIILGLTPATAGQVLYRGHDLTRLSGEQRRAFRRDVQAVFQDPYGVYNPFYRVDHVLTTPVRKFALAPNRAEARRMIEEALRAVGLRPEEILGRYPHQLSGGQRQRIMVARAVLMKPKLIVADEPVSMVDASLRATILGSLRKLTDEMGISIIYITHDLATAYQVSDNILVMYRACVAEAGEVERVVKHPEHPYTRLLISSIPKVSTARDWLADEAAQPARVAPSAEGCRFVARCPVAMPRCAESLPPLYRTEPGRATACYRYDTAPELAAADMQSVFASGAAAPAS